MPSERQILPAPTPSQSKPMRLPSSRRRSSIWIGLSLLGILGLAAYGYFGIYLSADDGPEKGKDQAAPAPMPIFVNWAKPDLAIIISAQEHGFLKECGCSKPQFGGLPRRFNFIKSLTDKGWPVVGIDVGEIAQASGPQALLKYEYSMKALSLMPYSAVGLGITEFNAPLFEALARYSLNHPTPTPIASNMKQLDPDNKKDRMFYDMNVRKYKIIEGIAPNAPKLAVFSITEATTEKNVKDPDVKFVPASQELAKLLQVTQPTKALNILIFQGTDDDPSLPQLLKENPRVSIVICLSSDPEPPARPKKIKGLDAQIFTVGHKGRYVGVIGLFKAPQGLSYHLKYELVSMSPQYETPEGKEATNPIIGLFQKYAQTVKDGKYAWKFPRGPHLLEVQAKALNIDTKYIGSDVCASCHQKEHAVWQKVQANGKSHSLAYHALENAKRPTLRQFDGECIVCHVVGWHQDKDKTGIFFQDNGGFTLDLFDPATAPPGAKPTAKEKLNEKLKHVGCESCHGPASAHANNPNDARLYPLINPLSTQRVPPKDRGNPLLVETFKATQLRRQDDFCQRCHDTENDVHWGEMKYLKKWELIDHIFPNPARQANQLNVGNANPQPVGVGNKKEAEK